MLHCEAFGWQEQFSGWVCLETKLAYRSPASLNIKEDVLMPPHDLKAEAHDGHQTPSDADSPYAILYSFPADDSSTLTSVLLWSQTGLGRSAGGSRVPVELRDGETEHGQMDFEDDDSVSRATTLETQQSTHRWRSVVSRAWRMCAATDG